MKSTVEPLEGNKVKVSVELDESEFDKAIDNAFRAIAREVRIPGFRPGKAPRRLLEARFGPDVAREHALKESLPDYYVDAVREHDVDVIAAPEIEITAGQESGPVAFDAVVEVRPRIEVPGYGGLRVEIPSPVPSDDDVQSQVDRLREQFSELAEVDRTATAGDVVTISLHGTEDDEPVSGLQADEYAYRVGAGSIAAELDEQLAGASVGDELEFVGDLIGTGRTVSFAVAVKKVQERVLPEVTDEWAGEVSEFETLDELRDDIRERIAGVRRVQAVMALREKAVESLVQLVDDEAPEPLVQREVRSRLEDLAMRLSAQGMSAEQYLTATGTSQEDLVASLKDTAAAAVKADLALRAVADAENIEIGDDDLDAEIEALAVRVKEKPDKVRKQLERNDQMPAIRSDLRTRRALDWLLEHVEIVDPEGNPIDRADLDLDAGPDHDHDHLHDHDHDHDHAGHDHDHDHDDAGTEPA
ncbi:MAG: trigger factor [Acidimicrobiia bacterium]|nr:trigger factor [Acidimicrobiia bacterium]